MSIIDKYKDQINLGNGIRWCSDCDKFISIEEFSKDSSTSDGLCYCCKTCQANRRNNRYHITRDRYLRKKYGISYDDELLLINKQGNKCAICGKFEEKVHSKTSKVFRLALDHCHSTGKIRGLLCSRCNKLLGVVNDDINTLKAAIKYLENNNE